MRRLSRGKKHESFGAFNVYPVSGIYAGYRHMVFYAQQGRRREGLLPRRTRNGRVGVRPFGGRERHERMGTHGHAGVHLCLRHGQGVDPGGAVHRLFAQLDLHCAAAALVLHRVRRLDHDPAVSDEPVQGELPRAADHQRGDLPRGVYRLFREQHQSVRHAL